MKLVYANNATQFGSCHLSLNWNSISLKLGQQFALFLLLDVVLLCLSSLMKLHFFSLLNSLGSVPMES